MTLVKRNCVSFRFKNDYFEALDFFSGEYCETQFAPGRFRQTSSKPNKVGHRCRKCVHVRHLTITCSCRTPPKTARKNGFDELDTATGCASDHDRDAHGRRAATNRNWRLSNASAGSNGA